MIKVRNLDNDTVNMVLYSDNSFATNKDNSCQLGYILFIAGKGNKEKCIEYESSRSTRVV